MSRCTLRRIRRLKATAAPIIAELDRRRREWKESWPSLAQDHLLRVIAVFQYGEPRIDEPLARECERALSKLDIDEQSLPDHLREIPEAEPPPGDIESVKF